MIQKSAKKNSSKKTITEPASYRRVTGRNLLEVMVGACNYGTYSSILELVSNSSDSDAQSVHIHYDPLSDFLAINDNGSGMDREGLEGFYRVGDSEKSNGKAKNGKANNEKTKLTPKGRPIIGQFGIGTLAIPQLCKKYSLATYRNGICRYIEEEFPENNSVDPDREIREQISECDPKKTGTEIRMTHLRFSKDHFHLDELKRRLQCELMIPNISYFINNCRVPDFSVSEAKRFKIDRTEKVAGHITGDIYLTDRTTPNSGIYLMVNGRKIGDEKALLKELVPKFPNRVVARISVPGLARAKTFNNATFVETDPAYINAINAISEELKLIKREGEKEYETNRSGGVLRRRKLLASHVKVTFERAGILTHYGKVVFDSTISDTSVLGRFDPTTGRISLNPDHPNLLIHPEMTTGLYQGIILGSAIDLISLNEANGSLQAFLEKRNSLWQKIHASAKSAESLEGNRYYSPLELSRFSGRSKVTIREMISAGLLKGEDDYVLGSEFQELDRKLTGLIGIDDFGALYSGDKNKGFIRERLIKIITELGETDAKPVFFTLRKNNSSPFYIIESACSNILEFMLREDPRLDNRSKRYNPNDAFRDLKNRKCSDESFAELTKLDLAYVRDTVLHALDNNFRALAQYPKNPEYYRFVDLVKVHQFFRSSRIRS